MSAAWRCTLRVNARYLQVLRLGSAYRFRYGIGRADLTAERQPLVCLEVAPRDLRHVTSRMRGRCKSPEMAAKCVH
jgi:hypothetical protein